ncbi:hypothetical protein FRC11_012245 [Ceratobasidium sp. 423]|nr:hypothetical protein FRC11_012245 [Ceratobasidium sp. 423]
MGLCQLQESSILLWGEPEFIDAETLNLHFTFYDSQGNAATMEFIEATPSYIDSVRAILHEALTPSYNINTIDFYDMLCPIPEGVNELLDDNHWTFFCQLMSRLLHFDDLGTPTLWPASVLKNRIRMLLEQALDIDFSVEHVLASGNPVLPCISLHGDIPETGLTPIDNWEPSLQDNVDTDLQGDEDVITEYNSEEEEDFRDDITILDAEIDGLASLGAHNERTFYVKAGNTMWTLYIDPMLAEQLLKVFQDDPLGLEAEQIPELLGRQNMWPGMGGVVHVMVLAYLDNILGPGLQGWILMDMTVEHGCVVEMDLLLPPFRTYDAKVFASLTMQLIGALNCVLPWPRLVQHSSAVVYKSQSIVLPQPHTGESLILVMLTHFCGKLLDQAVKSVNVGAIRQSICFYYSHSLRYHKVDDSFPWPALTDLDGRLRTVEIPEEVRQHRLSLEANRQPSPFEAFPHEKSHTLSVASPGPSTSFFVELAQSQTTHPQGMLVGTRGRSRPAFDKCVGFAPFPSWPEKFPYSYLHKPTAYSLDEFVDLIQALGGPDDPKAHHLLLTMTHHGRRITLDWLKDILYPLDDWLLGSWDVDSLTATFPDVPTILRTGNYYPYANWGLSMTARNELVVRIDGDDIDMHSCPNICLMTFGTNNRFRLLACYPGKRGKIPGTNQWRNIPNEPESRDWFDIFHTAMLMISEDIPAHWEHALEKTIEAFPDTYDIAKGLCSPTGQHRSFITTFIEPELLNLIFKKMRFVVNNTSKFALYRGYFFHLCGMNLKLGTQHIYGRDDTHPLNYAFQMNDFIDWTSLNSNDIIADVGLAVNVRRACAPLQFQRSTLLLNYGPLRELLRPGFKTPIQEFYVHSRVISGCHAFPSAGTKESGVIKVQVYHKDMLLTHKDKEHNLGANWTVDEALGNKDKYTKQIASFQKNIAQADTYGVRFEHRLTAWGADRLMQMDPGETVRRLVRADVIACHPTASVSAFKLVLSKTWTSIIQRQSQLPKASIRSPEVTLLTCVLAYLLKGLVRRPDAMSPTVQMVHRLSLATGAEEKGLPFLEAGVLDNDGLRMHYEVQAHTFKILSQTNVIVPGGQTFKTSRLQIAGPQPPRQRLSDRLYPVRPLSRPVVHPFARPAVQPSSPPTTSPQVPTADSLWPDTSQEFLVRLLNVHLPLMLWSFFPDERKATGTLPDKQRGKPFKKVHWSTVVEPLNTLKFVDGKYTTTLHQLFPSNWKVKSADGDFKRYDQDFLQRIRDHIESSVPEVRRTAYSAELRRRIRSAMFASWEYLPVVQARKMWPYVGKEGQRMYRVSSRYPQTS